MRGVNRFGGKLGLHGRCGAYQPIQRLMQPQKEAFVFFKELLGDNLDVKSRFQIIQRRVAALFRQKGDKLLLGGVARFCLAHQERVAPGGCQLFDHLDLAIRFILHALIGHTHQRKAPIRLIVAVISHQGRIAVAAVTQVVGNKVTLHGARPLQRHPLFEVHNQNIHLIAGRIGIGADALVLLHILFIGIFDECAAVIERFRLNLVE